MKHVMKTAAVLTGTMAMMGCSRYGLSDYDRDARSQPALLNSLYENDLRGVADDASTRRALQLPAKVAVVQVGEVAPAQRIIDSLRAEPAVFSRVEPMPGTDMSTATAQFQSNCRTQFTPPRPSLTTMRRMASDIGADYLLLVGGSVDQDTASTPQSFLDITIVGAFIVPSREARGTARASGALIDLQSGRIVLNSSAEAKRNTTVPSAQVSGAEVKLLEALRDDVLGKLGTQVLVDAKGRSAFGGAAMRTYPTLSAEAGITSR